MDYKKKVLVKNAASEKQVGDAVKKESSVEDRAIEDFRLVMQTKEGRRMVWGILSLCNVYSDIAPETNMTSFYLGQRSLGLNLIIKINQAGKEFYPMMATENTGE